MRQTLLRKARRELSRIGADLAALPVSAWRFLTERPYYDRVTRKQIRITEGSRPAGDKIAVYVLYPTLGVLPSHLRSLRWLAGQGYAPLVVSNLPLSDDDRTRLSADAWRVMERPNVGYDFGAYRDAVLEVRDQLPTLMRLVLLNDSCWFPMPGTEGWLAEAETLGPDFVGASYHWGIPRVDADQFQSMDWDVSTAHRRFHYGSYALSIGPGILRDPGFGAFWRRYRLSNDKAQTVSRGEMGLTRWVMRHGHSHGTPLDLTTLDRDLAAMPEARLHDLAQGLVLHEDALMRAQKLELLSGPGAPDRDALIKLILTSLARQGVVYALPGHMVGDKAFPFLKKTPVLAHEETHQVMQRFIDTLEADIRDEIRTETAALMQARGLSWGRDPGPG